MNQPLSKNKCRAKALIAAGDTRFNAAGLCARLIHPESETEQHLVAAQNYVEKLHKVTPELPAQFKTAESIDEWLENVRLFCEPEPDQIPDSLLSDHEGVAKGSDGSRFESGSGPVQTYDRSTADTKIGSSGPFAAPSHQESSRILTRYAPLGLLTGCVLQNMANPASCHTLLAAQAHAAHALLVGAGVHADNPAQQFRQMLEQLGIFLPEPGSRRFETLTAIPPDCWRLPAYWLSLSLFPGQYAGEILGAACCEALYGAPGIVRTAQKQAAPHHCALPEQQRRLEAALPYLKSAVQTLLQQDSDGRLKKCFVTGFATSAALLREWEKRCLDDWHQGRRQPQRAMVELVRHKARFACGYHSKLKLSGQNFDELIVQDAPRFVQELGQSRWVSPGHPEQSLLVTRLLAFGGPMFRIFTEQEEIVIRDWIRHLPHSVEMVADVADPIPGSMQIMMPEITESAPVACVRELYHQLLNPEQYPQVRRSAAAFCNRWLARSAHASDQNDNAPPFSDYSHSALRAWFEMCATTQLQSYAEDDGHQEKNRDDVIDEAVQLCPMILADGAWLQRWGNAGLVETPIGALLYKIFSDEIGNGDCALNHPNIYRALMQEMGIDLPDFRSREFVHFARFNQASFEVPVFWLSVSLFPQRYMPETLGLNLAMELSGVGGAYRRARDELRQHGFSTLFVDLHNTIDNVSSGHSAMALEAIELWMEPYLHSNNQQQMRSAWQRIQTGYRALSAPASSWREWLRPALYPY